MKYDFTKDVVVAEPTKGWDGRKDVDITGIEIAVTVHYSGNTRENGFRFQSRDDEREILGGSIYICGGSKDGVTVPLSLDWIEKFLERNPELKNEIEDGDIPFPDSD